MSFRRISRLAWLLPALLVASCSSVSGQTESHSTSAQTNTRARHALHWDGVWTGRAVAFPTGMAVDDRGVVTAGEEGGVAAIDSVGTLEWARFADGGPVQHPPALVDDVVAIPTATQVEGLERENGASRWAHPTADARVDAGRLEDGTAFSPGWSAVRRSAAGSVRLPSPSWQPSSRQRSWRGGDQGTAAPSWASTQQPGGRIGSVTSRHERPFRLCIEDACCLRRTPTMTRRSPRSRRPFARLRARSRSSIRG